MGLTEDIYKEERDKENRFYRTLANKDDKMIWLLEQINKKMDRLINTNKHGFARV